MNTTKILTLTILSLPVFFGCSRDYAPDEKASGEEIYKSACSECHQPGENGIIFNINSKNANPTYIAHKVKSGSLTMPSFPKMKAKDLKKLSTYVLENSKKE